MEKSLNLHKSPIIKKVHPLLDVHQIIPTKMLKTMNIIYIHTYDFYVINHIDIR